MARLNQSGSRNSARRAKDSKSRKRSLLSCGVDLKSIQDELGIGEKRAMAEAERRLGVVWRNGRFGNEKRGHARSN